MHYLEKVNFTRSSGEVVSFDENGCYASPILDVLNWVWQSDGSLKVQKVGTPPEMKHSSLMKTESFRALNPQRSLHISNITNVDRMM